VGVRGGAVRQGAQSRVLVHNRIMRGTRLKQRVSKWSCCDKGRECTACLLLAGFGGETVRPLLGSSGG
jgi:hypothetical protein